MIPELSCQPFMVLVLVNHMDEVLRESLVLDEGEELFAPEDKCKPFVLAEIAKKDGETVHRVMAH